LFYHEALRACSHNEMGKLNNHLPQVNGIAYLQY
jgi:hypothetical protein